MSSLLRIGGPVVLCLAVGIFSAGCTKEEPAAPAQQGGTQDIAQKACPVMGGPINEDIFADHQGRRVYFCCPSCLGTFNKDPEAVIKKLDAQGGAGQVPAKDESHEGEHGH